MRQLGDGGVGKPHPLRRCEQLRRERRCGKLVLHIRDMFELMDEPLVHLRDVRDLIDAELPATQRLGNDEDALVVHSGELLFDPLVIPVRKALHIEAVHADLE